MIENLELHIVSSCLIAMACMDGLHMKNYSTGMHSESELLRSQILNWV